MNVIYALSHDYIDQTPQDIIIQKLGIRTFNAVGASVKLGLSGYYQVALAGLRDVMETSFLLDYFSIDAAKILEWNEADQKTLAKHYRPEVIRDALDSRDGFTEKKRAKDYKNFCRLAAHATSDGFILLYKDDLGTTGPFLYDRLMQAWIEETVKIACSAAFALQSNFANLPAKINEIAHHHRREVGSWMRVNEERARAQSA